MTHSYDKASARKLGKREISRPRIRLHYTSSHMPGPFDTRTDIGRSGERIVSESIVCCGFELRDLNQQKRNYPAYDHKCEICGTVYQVKTLSTIRVNDGCCNIPMSKTFEETIPLYRHKRYIVVNYNRITKSLERIIITPCLSSKNIHSHYKSMITCLLEECIVASK